MTRTFKLIVSYDGSRYNGWQKQGNTPNTIQAKLEAVLSSVLSENVEVQGSGRTDAGVHALGQTVSFHANTLLSADELLRRIRCALPADIGAVSLEETDPRFHARLSATGKKYIYRIWNSSEPDVFERRYEWILAEQLDEGLIREAIPYFLGKHDFHAYCSRQNMKKSTIRTIRRIDVERSGSRLVFTFVGDGFLYNMVRLIMGTLVSTGLGQTDPAAISKLLESASKAELPPMAPAQGLFLAEVYYE